MANDGYFATSVSQVTAKAPYLPQNAAGHREGQIT
jgi:hypothetical protein